jgi:hypothetical protein
MTGKAFTACLRFEAEGEAAASFYASIFKGSKLGRLDRYTKARPGPAKDKYGLSWQVIPDALIDMICDPDPGRAKRHRGDVRDDQARHSDAPEGVRGADMKPAIYPILELEDLTRWPRPYSATSAGQIPACSQRCVAFSNKYATWNPS